MPAEVGEKDGGGWGWGIWAWGCGTGMGTHDCLTAPCPVLPAAGEVSRCRLVQGQLHPLLLFEPQFPHLNKAKQRLISQCLGL